MKKLFVLFALISFSVHVNAQDKSETTVTKRNRLVSKEALKSATVQPQEVKNETSPQQSITIKQVAAPSSKTGVNPSEGSEAARQKDAAGKNGSDPRSEK